MNAASAEDIDGVMRSSVQTTVDELVRRGGTVEAIVASRVAALGAAGGGADVSGDVPVKTKDGDVILSAQVYCFDAVVGFFRSGKVSFLGALTPGSFSAKVQVVVRGADALRTGDVVRVYGQVGISWKGKPSVFARHLVALSSPPSSSFAAASAAAAAARAAPPSELPPRLPFGGEVEGAEFVFSKGAGMSPPATTPRPPHPTHPHLTASQMNPPFHPLWPRTHDVCDRTRRGLPSRRVCRVCAASLRAAPVQQRRRRRQRRLRPSTPPSSPSATLPRCARRPRRRPTLRDLQPSCPSAASPPCGAPLRW